MDRVIPKDIADLIYKESHLGNIKRLNAEYHKLFFIGKNFYNTVDVLCYKYMDGRHSYLNDRDLCSSYCSVLNFKKRIGVDKLPKRYFYSSGHLGLKWIE